MADRYRIERELGAGGMATVYLAEDLKHHRKVAIKVLHAELSAMLGPERFLKEIELTANLQHPHILPLFDSGSADGLLYYVMPYVDGETLRGRLERERQLPIADSIRIASEVADALEYAHKHGVIHRDIKPENILLHDGHVLVADFGIALAVQQAGGQRMTQTGLSLGTPQYMSPEQAMSERNIDARSDIYALGAVTYEMLAGEQPFTGPTAQAIVARVMTDNPRPLPEVRQTVTSRLDDAVATALQRLPADRFTSAAEFAAALSAPDTQQSARSASRATTSASRRLIVALCALSVIAIAAAVWGWVRAERRPTAATVSPWRTVLTFPDSVALLGGMALSPDGSALVYVASGPHGSQLWIRDATSLTATPIPGTDGGNAPAFSPDGRRIAFMLVGGTLNVIPRNGGTPIVVKDSLHFDFPPLWADDDHIVFAGDSGLIRVPVNGGKPQVVTTMDRARKETALYGGSVLPDGRSIVFMVVSGNLNPDAQQIGVSDPQTGRHTYLMPGIEVRYVAPGYLLVARVDSTIVAVPFDAAHRRITGRAVTVASGVRLHLRKSDVFTVAANGRLVYATGTSIQEAVTVARVKRDGSSTVVDPTWVGDFNAVAVSPDGSQVAVATGAPEDIHVRDMRSGALNSFASPYGARYPVFTTTGRAVVFTGLSGSGGYIYQSSIGTAAPPVELMHDRTGLVFDPAFSANGQTLFYARRSGTDDDIFAHSMDHPSAPNRPVVATPAFELSPQTSPDGRWLAYASGSDINSFDIYVRSVDPSRAERWQISHGGGKSPRWSRDGRQLFYLTRDSLVAVQVSSGPEFAVQSQHALFSTAGFDTDPRAAYDVLPGDAGFIMLKLGAAQKSTLRLVMLDDWRAALADSSTTVRK
jgi:serine/threonine-protein kinase